MSGKAPFWFATESYSRPLLRNVMPTRRSHESEIPPARAELAFSRVRRIITDHHFPIAVPTGITSRPFSATPVASFDSQDIEAQYLSTMISIYVLRR